VSSVETWLRFERVGFRYAGDVALAGVDLELGAGERLVVVGPNGGGKTTLLRLLLGLARPDGGRIVRSPRAAPLRCGYVPQFPAFDRGFPLRVEEVILDGRLGERRQRRGSSRGAEHEVARAAVDDVVLRLDLGALRHAYLSELSGGELKRTLVARALVGRPELLVLDEPTASLDEAARAALWRLIAELPAETAVVLATHDLAPGTFRPTRALRVDRGVTELALDELHGEALLCGHGHD
jgi:zinc transport system ATP-binding protein